MQEDPRIILLDNGRELINFLAKPPKDFVIEARPEFSNKGVIGYINNVPVIYPDYTKNLASMPKLR